MYEIEEDGDGEFLSWSSSILSNVSMNSDSDDDEFVDQFHVAFHNGNALACDFAQTILHENIDWQWKCDWSIDKLSSDDALTFFSIQKSTLQNLMPTGNAQGGDDDGIYSMVIRHTRSQHMFLVDFKILR
jgi:hypothetical protein